MAARWKRRDALYQAIAVAVIVALVVGGSIALHRRPQGPDSLKAEVSVLRSQASEAALVLDAVPRLNERFLRAHAGQLAKNVEREQDKIAHLNLQSKLLDAQRFAHNAAQRLHDIVQPVAEGAIPSPSAAPRVLAGELEVLERTLQR